MQSLKLGEVGAEIELPTKSRSFGGERSQIIKKEGRSVNGTLHSDYSAYKRTFRIGWETITEDNKKVLEDVVKLQLTGVELNFIRTDKTGTPENISVSATLGGFGALNPRGEYFYYGTGLTLEER